VPGCARLLLVLGLLHNDFEDENDDEDDEETLVR